MKQKLLVLLSSLILSPTLTAADAVSMSASGSQVLWTNQVELPAGYGWQLTIAGPEDWYFKRQFAAGDQASFSLSDNPADGTPAGSYQWELTAVLADASHASSRQDGDQANGAQAITASGTFSIAKGSLVASEASEDSTRDVVHADDVIVQGSLCVGFDCVDNESFGFDTIRLKENNLRIKFEDTSSSAGFPSTDWQLTANDSASGGASKFSIEDITNSKVPFTITAGAATNSLFIDSTGRLGLKTSTPVLDVHVKTGNTPSLRLEQDSSSGFSAQTWDIGANEANFFIRDVTTGSKLPFRIRPGAPSSSIDIASDGQVGVGTGTPTARLHVKAADGEAKFRIE